MDVDEQKRAKCKNKKECLRNDRSVLNANAHDNGNKKGESKIQKPRIERTA